MHKRIDAREHHHSQHLADACRREMVPREQRQPNGERHAEPIAHVVESQLFLISLRLDVGIYRHDCTLWKHASLSRQLSDPRQQLLQVCFGQGVVPNPKVVGVEIAAISENNHRSTTPSPGRNHLACRPPSAIVVAIVRSSPAAEGFRRVVCVLRSHDFEVCPDATVADGHRVVVAGRRSGPRMFFLI